MIEAGSIVDCLISKTALYGAYGELETGEIVFINFSELCWTTISSPDEVVNVGDRVPVLIQGQSAVDSTCFLGSIKRALEHPWSKFNFMIGHTYQGIVCKTGSAIMFVELAPSAVVGVKTDIPADVGDEVNVRIVHLDWEHLRIDGELVD